MRPLNQPAPLRVAVVGGSNTVMTKGYVRQFVEQFERRRGPVEIVMDLSVGATRSVFGASQIMTQDDLGQVDLFLIEYALNDEGWERRGTSMLEFWTRLNESVIRDIIQRAPGAMIAFVVLSRKEGPHRERINLVHALTHYLARHYRCGVVDIHDWLYDTAGLDHATWPGFYADQAHYGLGVPTALIGGRVADGVMEMIDGDLRPRMNRLLNSGTFAEIIRMTVDSTIDDTPLKDGSWKNSRYDLRPKNMALGDTVRFAFDGELLAIDLVSHPDSPAMALTHDDKSWLFPTARKGLNRFPFLYHQQVLAEHGIAIGAAGRRTEIELTACRPEDAPAGARIFPENWLMRYAKPGEGPLSLLNITIGLGATGGT